MKSAKPFKALALPAVVAGATAFAVWTWAPAAHYATLPGIQGIALFASAPQSNSVLATIDCPMFMVGQRFPNEPNMYIWYVNKNKVLALGNARSFEALRFSKTSDNIILARQNGHDLVDQDGVRRHDGPVDETNDAEPVEWGSRNQRAAKSLAVSPDGRFAVFIVDTTPPDHLRWLYRFLSFGDVSFRARFADALTGATIRSLPGTRQAMFSPNGEVLATVCDSSVHLYKVPLAPSWRLVWGCSLVAFGVTCLVMLAARSLCKRSGVSI